MPYAIVLSEAVLGPTDLAVRLPTALAGIGLVLALFLLGRELYGTRVGLLAAALLAVSPWHVQVSRLAFRAGLLPLTMVLGLWLFLVALRRGRGMFLAGLVLGLGLHTYLAARLFLPLLLIGLIVIFRRPLLSRRAGRGGWWDRPVVRLLAGVGLMALPLAAWGLLHPAEFVGHAAESAGQGGPLRQALDVMGRYVAYFGSRHLLTQGDPYPVPSTGRFGLLYWPLLSFALAGLARMAWRHVPADLLVLWWLVVYPIPAALTRGSHPDWLRAACGIGVWEILTAAGVAWSLDWLRDHATRRVTGAAAFALGAGVAASAGWFLWDYARLFPDRAAWAFSDGIEEAVRELVKREGDYARVVLPADMAAVHDFYLLYARYEPARLQREGLQDVAAPGEWADVRAFGKHRVCDPAVCCGAGDLCLVRGEWNGSGDTIATVRDRGGRIAFTIVAGD